MDNQTADFNRLPVLSGAENYQFWSQRLTSILRMRGLWRYVSREQDAPFAPETRLGTSLGLMFPCQRIPRSV